MANSNSGDSDIVMFTIKANGKRIDSMLEVESIDTWHAINRVPKARVVLFDGSSSSSGENFEISSGMALIPGVQVSISVGNSGGGKAEIFKGVVTKQKIEITETGSSRLVVEMADKALKMTLDRKNALFENGAGKTITDNEVIKKLITTNGLKADVASTKGGCESLVQYYATDWDMMLTRAQRNGLVVIVNGGEVSVKPPDTSKAPALTLTHGESILELNAEMDAATQFSKSAIESVSWDESTQKLIESRPGAVSVKEPGNIDSEKLSKVFGVKKLTQQTGASIDKQALQEWSSAELLRSKLTKIRGSVKYQGSSLAKTGGMLGLANVGSRFNGNVFVSGIHHRIAEGLWVTAADFGLSAISYAVEESSGIAAPGASGLLPPVSGLQTGKVTKVAKDPAGEFRIEIELPLLQDKNKKIWARLGTFYASSKVGALFYPELGDEVVVGFMNDDPRDPVILGSLYSKKLAPPVPPDERNRKKLLRTRGELELSFDDEDKIIEITTPGKQSIRLDDKAGKITLRDSNQNKVELSKSGIVLDSASNIRIAAKGNITIDAKGNLKASGTQIDQKATAKFSASGALSEVKASGPLTLRGAIIKIN